MGLWAYIFGSSEPSDEETVVTNPEKIDYRVLPPPSRTSLQRPQAMNRSGSREPEAPEEKASQAPHLIGYERRSHRLGSRIRGKQLGGSRWGRLTGKIRKLERKLGEAESPEELRDIAKRAMRPETGIFRKIERGLEKRLDKENLSLGERRRYERDLRSMQRRLERPSRFLR